MSLTQPEWTLWYWPGMKGRGEFVRLIFEEAGVPYLDKGRTATMDEIVEYFFKGGNTNFPLRAPPSIQHGDFVLCNTPAIQSYLGRKFGLMPESSEGQAHVDQILGIVTDGIGEGRLAFHPKDFYASHTIQVEESKPYIEQYGTQRLPKYLAFFEAVLARSTSGFLVGDMLTVADLAAYQYLSAAKQHYPTYYEKENAPLTKAFRDRIEERPRIKEYLASDRVLPWAGDSMC